MIEQCPNDATALVRDDNGLYCVVCGYPRSERRPTHPPELADYIERLRRNEGGADAKGLVELAQKLGLRWGRPELTPDRSLKLNRFDGPVLAVQEAIGSDKYLVVLCGEASWSIGLVQFFKVEDGKGPSPTRVRLGREAVAQIIGGESLQCLNPGELKVVARKPKPRRKSPVAGRRLGTEVRAITVAGEPLPGETTAPDQRNFLRAFVKTVAALLVALLPSLFLFYPFLHRWLGGTTKEAPAPLDIPDPPAENLLLDSFIVRDASKSADDAHYIRIEDELLKRLSTKEGDRISYSVFGTDTFPLLIPAPAESDQGVAAQRLATRNITFSTTDFSNLFNKLGDAIRRDREAQRKEEKEEPHRPHHADAVLIISDGVPDLTPGALHCPKADEPFISPEIIDAFDALIHQKYATQEPLYVRLLIVGTDEECDSSIKQAWKTALGEVSDPVTFRALSYFDLITDASNSWGNVERELLKSLRRQPRVILSLRPVQEEERVKLDSGQVFSIQYAARSFLRGGSLHVRYGSLEEREGGAGGEGDVTGVEAAKLHAIHDPHLSATQPDSQPTIVAPPPPPGRLWGPIKKGSIYLKPENSSKLADSSTYQLRLSIVSEGAFEVLPTEPISLTPCSYADAKNEIRKNLGVMKYVPVSIGIVFLLGVLFWAFAEPNSGHWITKVRQLTEVVFIANWKPWIIALIAFLLPMSIAGMICAPRPAFLYVAFALASVFNFLSFYLEGSKKYPRHYAATGVSGEGDGTANLMWLNLSFHCVQGICLPLMIEATAKQLF